MKKIIEFFAKDRKNEIKFEEENSNKYELVKKQLKELEEVKEKISNLFLFKIPEYILLDIVDEEDYQHFCLMVNLAKVNERITDEQASELKERIKEVLNIKDCYDRLKISNLKGA